MCRLTTLGLHGCKSISWRRAPENAGSALFEMCTLPEADPDGLMVVSVAQSGFVLIGVNCGCRSTFFYAISVVTKIWGPGEKLQQDSVSGSCKEG